MRIVQIEDFVHPETGYQVNILSKYFSNFGHEVFIVTSELNKIPEFLTSFFGMENIEEKDEWYRKQTGVKIIRVPIIKYVSGRSVYTGEIFKVVDKLNPDVLFVHGEDTLIGMQYILKVKRLKCALIMDSHQYDMASRNPFREQFYYVYRRIFTPIIKKYRLKTVRLVEHDDYMQRHFDIPQELTPYISYGTDTLLFHPDDGVRRRMRERHQISPEDFVVVYAGKLDESKGGDLLAGAVAEKLKTEKDIVFLIVGNTVGSYGEKVEAAFTKSENRIIRIPTQKYNDLAQFFQMSDACVFPKECSLTFFDAQACGLPVVSEDNEVNVERCAHFNGMIFKKGDVEDFRKHIAAIADMPDETRREMSSNALSYVIRNFNYFDIAKEFEELLKREYVRQKEERKF